MIILAYQNLSVDYLVCVNSLVDFYGLICLVWIDFCVVGVVFVMGWAMFKGVLINLGLIFFFFCETESGFVICSSSACDAFFCTSFTLKACNLE